MSRLAVLLLCLAACRGYEPRDFARVCSEGKPAVNAPAYEPATVVPPGEDYPVFFAEKRATLKHWIWGAVPEPLVEAGVVMTDRHNYERAQLVVCLEQVEGPWRFDCDMEGTTLKLHDARYNVSVREARTARVLATRSYESKVKDCPRTVVVSFAEKVIKQFADIPDDELIAPLAPHLPDKTRARLTEVLTGAAGSVDIAPPRADTPRK